ENALGASLGTKDISTAELNRQSIAMDNTLDTAISIVQRTLQGELPRPDVQTFFDPDTFTASHIVRDPGSNTCAIIDSVLDFDYASGRTAQTSAMRMTAHIQAHALQTQWVLETHAHADHLSAAPLLIEELGGRLAIGKHITTVQNVFGKIFNAGTEFAR